MTRCWATVSRKPVMGKARMMESQEHDFKPGDVVYLNYSPSEAYTVERVNMGTVYVVNSRGVKTMGPWRIFTRVPMHGTIYSTLDDQSLSEWLYDVEHKLKSPIYSHPNDRAIYEREIDRRTCLLAEYLDRQRDGGIWSSGD